MEMKRRLLETGMLSERELECATPHELFEYWCNYEGLVGYADKILEALADCDYEVKSHATHKVIKCVYLDEMPFDKNGVHATGNYVQFDNGNWELEYADSDFEYADDCVYEYEDGSPVPTVKNDYFFSERQIEEYFAPRIEGMSNGEIMDFLAGYCREHTVRLCGSIYGANDLYQLLVGVDYDPTKALEYLGW